MSNAIDQEGIVGSVATPAAAPAPEAIAAPAPTSNTPAAAPASPSPAPAPLSLDEALAKAIETHTPSDDSKPTGTGLLPPTPGAPAARPAAPPTLQPGQTIDPITQRVLDPIKPPGSLTPALRDTWKDIPREHQQFWADRERDMATRLQETAEARKNWGEFREVAQPYEPLLRQHNITATAHAKELFNLSYGLNTGSPQQRADILARLIHQFQPDPQALSHYLSPQGRPQGLANGPQAQPQQPVNVRSEMENLLKERDEAARLSEGKSAWEKWSLDPANEFLGDVKELMGKILDAELVSGNSYPELFKNAYDLACQQHPQVKAALDARGKAAAPAPAAPAAAPAPTPRPNNSVKPSLGASRPAKPNGGKLMSLDEAIAAAAAAHGA